MTVHLVDEGVDTGPASLQARIQDVERPLYVDAVGRLARSGWTVEGRTVHRS